MSRRDLSWLTGSVMTRDELDAMTAAADRLSRAVQARLGAEREERDAMKAYDDFLSALDAAITERARAAGATP